MNDKVMTKPSEVVRDFFQELVAGLPTGNMGRLWRGHDRGGHFPMLEQTDTLAVGIVAFADLVGFKRGNRFLDGFHK
jgi:hypothetical protein